MCDKYRTCATSINWSEPRALRHTPAQPPDEKARGRRRPKIVDALARRDHVRMPIDGRVKGGGWVPAVRTLERPEERHNILFLLPHELQPKHQVEKLHRIIQREQPIVMQIRR